MTFDLEELAEFLVTAKKATYAGDGAEVATPERPGFKELQFTQGDWDYRDSYAGFFLAPGQEVVRFQGRPVWAMSYTGGMTERFQNDQAFATQYAGLTEEELVPLFQSEAKQKVLGKVEVTRPFRGPEEFLDTAEWTYQSKTKGDISDFLGEEFIHHRGEDFMHKTVFKQAYLGGLIVPKEF